jgi:hypothetical protein
MPSESSLKFMMDAFPKRVFDVGISEQHAALSMEWQPRMIVFLQYLFDFYSEPTKSSFTTGLIVILIFKLFLLRQGGLGWRR